MKMAQRLMARDPDGAAQMRSLYPIMVSVEHSVQHYRKFFEILLRHEEGALLYHCTMGKDRVGTATALILSALGVPRETIYADYLIRATAVLRERRSSSITAKDTPTMPKR